MKKLEDYKGQKIAIHFPTYELWLRRKEINPSDSLKNKHYDVYKDETCYFVDYTEKGNYGSLKFAKEDGYTIIPATDFLEEEFIYGQEYEFSDDEVRGHIEKFMCKLPDGRFISWDDTDVTIWNYCRKINTERNEAITTIKELVSKHSINQNEVF